MSDSRCRERARRGREKAGCGRRREALQGDALFLNLKPLVAVFSVVGIGIRGRVCRITLL
jgi:hypothetical protein